MECGAPELSVRSSEETGEASRDASGVVVDPAVDAAGVHAGSGVAVHTESSARGRRADQRRDGSRLSAIFFVFLVDLAVRSLSGHGLIPRDGSLDGRMWIVLIAAVALDVSQLIAWFWRSDR